jgi:uncharacterized protein Veg
MAIVGEFSAKPISIRDQEEDIYHRIHEIKSEIEKLTIERIKTKAIADEWEKTSLLNEAYASFVKKVHQEFNNSSHIDYSHILTKTLKLDFFSDHGLSGKLSQLMTR